MPRSGPVEAAYKTSPLNYSYAPRRLTRVPVSDHVHILVMASLILWPSILGARCSPLATFQKRSQKYIYDDSTPKLRHCSR